MLLTASARLVLAAVLAVALAQAAFAEVAISKRITYFTVKGATAEALDESLSRHGPKTQTGGMRHPGATRIKFGGSVTYAEAGGICRIDTVRVTLTTQLMLPRWQRPRNATPGLSVIWNTLSADIKRHEERHAEIARNHARKMEKLFLKLRPAPSCAQLQARVTELAQQALDAHDSDQARFDRIEAASFEDRMMRLLRYRNARPSPQN